MRSLIATLMRFGLVGGLVTGLVYLAFTGLLRLGVNYLVAATIGWALGVGLSYVLNRSFTFGVKERARPREFGAFVGGYLLQLGMGLVTYWLLMGVLRLNASLAFLVNLVGTASFSFVFMRWVVFTGRTPARG
jgi:putative flippase GtrA